MDQNISVKIPQNLQTNNNVQVVNPNEPKSSISISAPTESISLTQQTMSVGTRLPWSSLNVSSDPISLTTPEKTTVVANNYQIGASNPLLFNAPIYIASGVDDKAKTENPNVKLEKLAKEQTKTPDQKKDKDSELNSGGVKSHTITSKEIKDLEKQTNLTLYPYLFSGELARIRHQFTNLNKNKYYLLLNMLVFGFDNKVLQSGIYGDDKCVIDKQFIDDFLRMAKIPQLQNIIKKTPAYKKGCFKEIGKLGITQANANNMNTDVMTGPQSEVPRTAAEIMDRLHPNSVSNLDAFCNKVRTSAYLTLPKRAFGALVSIVSSINGILLAFNQLISDIYNGIMAYIQQIFGLINGLIAKIQQLIMNFLESIIPVDILCILIAILKSMLKDVPFFSSLMNMSNLTSEFETKFRDYVYDKYNLDLENFADDPLGEASKLMPPQISKMVKMAKSFAKNPNSFLSNAVLNYGYGLAAKQTQSALYERILDEMGPSFVDMNIMGKILGVNRDPDVDRPQGPDVLGPTYTKNCTCDFYGHPLDSSKIKSNVA